MYVCMYVCVRGCMYTYVTTTEGVEILINVTDTGLGMHQCMYVCTRTYVRVYVHTSLLRRVLKL
jgi:hypothetical protein